MNKLDFSQYINSDDTLERSYEAIVETLVDSSHLSKNEFFEKIFETAFVSIPTAEKGSYYELKGDYFVPILSKGYDIDLLNELKFSQDNVFIGFEIDDDDAIESFEFKNRVRDASKFTSREIEVFKGLGTYGEFTSIYAPIKIQGETVGMLSFEKFDGTSYTRSDRLILKLYAKLISDYYLRIINRERERQLFEETVSALVSAIEIKDKYTEGHAQRVKEMAIEIAREMGFSELQITNIATAAVLHDIGKIGIRSDILTKPGKLTSDEYELIKEHPSLAKKVLDNISDFTDVVDIIYMHHERHDGKGYPRGIAGDDISIEAAIISVVDAYDSMTSNRSYRMALPKEKAFDIIMYERGKQFNPIAVDHFEVWYKKQI